MGDLGLDGDPGGPRPGGETRRRHRRHRRVRDGASLPQRLPAVDATGRARHFLPRLVPGVQGSVLLHLPDPGPEEAVGRRLGQGGGRRTVDLLDLGLITETRAG